MVKKKSHEERHDETLPQGKVLENEAPAASEGVSKEVTEEQSETAVKEEAEPAEKPSLEEELTRKLTEMQDKYLRLAAEFDNYRKRTLREKIELTRSGGESVILNLLPVIDDFERALTSIRDTENCAAVKAGMDLIYNKLADFLKQCGVSEIAALNETFDGDLHEAVTRTAVDDEALKGKVVEVVQKGYSLHGKTIRFPKVVVGE